MISILASLQLELNTVVIFHSVAR